MEAADAARTVRAGAISRRASEQRVEVGLAAVRGPRLHAVDHEFVAVGYCPGGERGRVGSAARLRQAVGPELVAAEHVGQPALALLRRASCRNGIAGQRVHADAQADCEPRRCEFLDDLEVGLVWLTATTLLFWVGQA